MLALRVGGRFLVRRSLVLFCIAATIAFHAVNAQHGEALAPLRAWKSQIRPTRIVLGPRDHELVSFAFVDVSDPPVDEKKTKPDKPKSKRRQKKTKKSTAAARSDAGSSQLSSLAASATTSSAATPKKTQFEAGHASAKARPHLDTASQWLSWVGLHLRAQVNQSQPRWLNFSLRRKRIYYLRDELEFQYERHAPVVHDAFSEVTRLMAKTVRNAGATLVIAPMPTKVSIYRDRLPSWLPDQQLWSAIPPRDEVEDPYLVYSAARDGAPAETLDLFKTFSEYHRDHPEDDIYIPSNHQWSSLGIGLTAVQVLQNLRERGWDLEPPRLVKRKKRGVEYDRPLLELLNLPPAFAALYPQTTKREQVYGVNEVADGDSSRRLIVFGTCFSNRLRGTYGFSETLAGSLRRSTVINLSAEGGKTLPSFRDFAKRVKRLEKGDLVVWEFNVRETFTRAEVQRIRRYLKQIAKRSRAQG